MDTSQPLTSSDQGKLLVFAILMTPTILFIVGIIPVIFIAFGIYMMKKNGDFSAVTVAVRNANICAGLIAAAYIVLVFLSSSPRSDDGFYAMLGAIVVLAGFIISVQLLFYAPLKAHRDWVATNGIFSKTKKVDRAIQGGRQPDIIKGEKFKQYSVADELLKWSQLRDGGHITDEDFSRAKEKLLNGH